MLKDQSTFWQDHEVFPWWEGNSGCFRGYVYDDQDEKLEGEMGWNWINQKYHQNGFSGCNGCFAFVAFNQSETIILSDFCRSIPVFFIFHNGRWRIGDDGFKMKEALMLEKDEEQAYHFEAFSFCPNHSTPWKGLSQIQALESVILKCDGTLSIVDYSWDNKSDDGFASANDDVFNRLIKEKISGNYVVPLSGGWDSRQILVNLIRLGAKNIVTYTYGLPDSNEVKTAEKVARKLGVDWHFIQYDSDLLDELFSSSGTEFLRYASQGISSPQEQEFFALHHLKRIGVVKKGDVIVPGYCGDLPAGSYVMAGWKQTDRASSSIIKSWISDRHLVFARGSGEEDRLLKMLYSTLEPSEDMSISEWNERHEHWFIKEKVSKYVLNGLRTFEFLGLEWRMPFWDLQWLAYSYSCTFEQRKNRAHFKQQCNFCLFEPMNISHVVHDNPGDFSVKLKGKLKKILPPFVLNNWLNLRFKKADLDNTNGSYLVNKIQQQLNMKRKWSRHALNPHFAAYVWRLLN